MEMETLEQFVRSMEGGAGFMRGHGPAVIGELLRDHLPKTDLDRQIRVKYTREDPSPFGEANRFTSYVWTVEGYTPARDVLDAVTEGIRGTLGRGSAFATEGGFEVFYQT